ncbi:hypothetical protein [Zobellia alginiliquefaciens]|uniref:hypothetical protein n=1 Tax=Zobellia alginiliquefaciens TaxID=3032586 RepID=UPI0023E370CD|nr:hypothetical protein [Zobellia alginiliquefaciens]
MDEEADWMNNKSKNYSQWRTRYLRSKNIESRKNILLFFVSMFFLTFTFLGAYLWWTDEFKFLGKTVIYVNAAVTQENMKHWGRGYYYQIGVCNYIVEGKEYSSDFRINDSYLLAKIGDTIVVKTTLENPKISKFIGYP